MLLFFHFFFSQVFLGELVPWKPISNLVVSNTNPKSRFGNLKWIIDANNFQNYLNFLFLWGLGCILENFKIFKIWNFKILIWFENF